MFLNIILLIVSLAMILFGAGWLTDGGSALAKRMGLSEMMIGLTIVAFGTSAPELVISVASAIEGNAGLAIGNVVGSNIANVLLIIGITAMVRPIHVGRSVLSNEMPLVILCSVALLACGNTGLLDGLPDAVTRVDGIRRHRARKTDQGGAPVARTRVHSPRPGSTHLGRRHLRGQRLVPGLRNRRV